MNVTKYGFKFSGLAFCVLIIICCLSGYAYAHKVSIYAYAEDGKVFAEGYFVDGSKAKNSIVEVFDAVSGEKLLEVKTDKNGSASFDIPEGRPLKLVIIASMGHKNDYTISEDELREAMGVPNEGAGNPASEGSELVKVDAPRIPESEVAMPDGAMGLSITEVEAIVGRVLDKKLRPIKNILLQMQESLSRPGMTEVLGGIGYILGLTGIVMYFKGRRR